MCQHDDGNGQIHRIASGIDCGWSEECHVSGTLRYHFFVCWVRGDGYARLTYCHRDMICISVIDISAIANQE